MCYVIMQTEKKTGKLVLWAVTKTLPETIEIVQYMVDGMRDGWEDEFQIICGEESIAMQRFIEDHNIKKRSIDERMGIK